MREHHILYTKQLLSTHSLSDCNNKANSKSALRGKKEDTKYKKPLDRDYVGKYCLVDWLDDSAVIDCSLIHEWD
jgi:hypothetical protein